MSSIQTPGQVFDAVQRAKTGATDFCTNFFPVESKLHDWIHHGKLFAENHNGAAFFFRTDRDFRHFYFCAADRTALAQGMAALPGLKTDRVVTDLVGNESTLSHLLPPLEQAGFRRYSRLQRLARIGRPETGPGDPSTRFAEKADGPEALGLIEHLFDRFGEQLPMLHEMESAIENHQVLAARHDGELAGLLFFETQGLASSVRFWAVAEKFRARRVGSALMQHYFQTHGAVRRFTLWVNSNNENAISKYRHYGYAPDGLVDQVLANDMINP
jgi:ribosomal protein S18 acetylase RimI-like enzyme